MADENQLKILKQGESRARSAMADENQLKILKQGVATWNEWRHEGIQVDLSGANFSGADLSEANFSGADLREANLSGANLAGAYLRGANLRRANLSRANLSGADLLGANLSYANLRAANLLGADLRWANLRWADLFGADLIGANLSEANLSGADLSWADLSECNLGEATFAETGLSNVDLSSCKGLELIEHEGPSPIDIRTLQLSGPLPLVFLRGVGLPDTLIEYLPSLLNQSIQLYSCFISYSAKDEEFVRRLYADLQDKGVRCWFAPHDMKIGDEILDALDKAIRLRDKVLLVLSDASIASRWVKDEVTKGFAEERQRGGVVLFPVRLDDAVFTTNEAWALKLRDNRNIGDFRSWKDHDAYQKTLARLLRDLRIQPS
jgi:TIR domain/Pentapeptide repeats (8 copies)